MTTADEYNELLTLVSEVVEAGHMDQEYLARFRAHLGHKPVDSKPPKATEKDINRWREAITKRPEGPWEMGCGGSFDRMTVHPISDEMLVELAHWMHMGYTPWNGRSIPLSDRDRQFMFLLYYSVQGLVSRVRSAERIAAPPQEAVASEPVAQFEDPRVQTVYDILCSFEAGNDLPPLEQHWEGWVSRRIVDALGAGSERAQALDSDIINAAHILASDPPLVVINKLKTALAEKEKGQ